MTKKRGYFLKRFWLIDAEYNLQCTARNRDLLLLCACLLTAAPVTASASSVGDYLEILDDTVFGPGSITRDNRQGLDFLDVTRTMGLGYDHAFEATLPGGAYEGFRHATRSEVRTMARNGSIEGGRKRSDPYGPVTRALGVTDPGSIAETIGYVKGRYPAERRSSSRSPTVRIMDYPRTPANSDQLRNQSFPSGGVSYIGHFLARPTGDRPMLEFQGAPTAEITSTRINGTLEAVSESGFSNTSGNVFNRRHTAWSSGKSGLFSSRYLYADTEAGAKDAAIVLNSSDSGRNARVLVNGTSDFLNPVDGTIIPDNLPVRLSEDPDADLTFSTSFPGRKSSPTWNYDHSMTLDLRDLSGIEDNDGTIAVSFDGLTGTAGLAHEVEYTSTGVTMEEVYSFTPTEIIDAYTLPALEAGEAAELFGRDSAPSDGYAIDKLGRIVTTSNTLKEASKIKSIVSATWNFLSLLGNPGEERALEQAARLGDVGAFCTRRADRAVDRKDCIVNGATQSPALLSTTGLSTPGKDVMMFDYMLANMDVEDTLAVFLNDNPVYKLDGITGEASGSVAFYLGQKLQSGDLLTFGLVSDDAGREFQMSNIRFGEQVATVPGPASAICLATGMFFMIRLGRRNRKAHNSA